MYDCMIVGAGAAGVSAALTLKALNKSFIWLGNPKLSEKIRRAEKINNYPGLNAVSGEELQATFSAQLKAQGIEITPCTVNGIYPIDGGYTAMYGENSAEARTVILTVGVSAVKPIAGEEEFLGRGVSYCATCDGFLYKGKTVAVVCTTKEEEHEAAYLSELADKVYFFPLYKNAALDGGNIEIIKAMPDGISGDTRVRSVSVGERRIEVDGVFMLKEARSPSSLVYGIKAENGIIVTDRDMSTNLKGVYAAGDCTGKPYQYAKAVGEGNIAAHSVNAYLANIGK